MKPKVSVSEKRKQVYYGMHGDVHLKRVGHEEVKEDEETPLHWKEHQDQQFSHRGILGRDFPSFFRDSLSELMTKMYGKGEGRETSYGVVELRVEPAKDRAIEVDRLQGKVMFREGRQVEIELRNLDHFKDIIGEQWHSDLQTLYREMGGI